MKKEYILNSNSNLKEEFENFKKENNNDESFCFDVLSENNERKSLICFFLDSFFNDDSLTGDYKYNEFILEDNESYFDSFF